MEKEDLVKRVKEITDGKVQYPAEVVGTSLLSGKVLKMCSQEGCLLHAAS